MRLVLDSRLRIEGIDAEDPAHAAVVDRLRERFTYDNPVYWDARRFRRPCRHIPRKIGLFEEPWQGSASAPRGARREVAGLLGPLFEGETDATVLPPRGELGFRGELRDYQEAAVAAALAERQGVVQAPTGSGKTVVALAVVARVPTQALIVVHTSVLFEQTAERVRQFLGVEPGLLGAGHDDVRDVTIAMVQTLMRRDLAPLADAFGLVILDEAHHCPAETFKSVVQAFAARFRLGFTATPARRDRLHPVLFDVVGPIIHSVAPKTLVATGSIAPSEVVEVQTEFRAWYTRDYQAMVNRIVKNERRNELIADTVARLHAGRSLVLTERVAHGETLAERLVARHLPAVTISGETPREERDDVIRRFAEGDVGVLVATTALVGEGFDLPAIDTVFLTVPSGNVAKTTQALGRALRPHEGKAAGRVVDFVDGNVPMLKNQFKKRQRVYKGFAL
jgi:superfamily II DNA or RNA helicase